MFSDYLCLDIENDNTGKYKRSAGNFKHDKIVAIGYKYPDTIAESVYNPEVCHRDALACILAGNKLLVGHNLTHDLLFLWQNDDLQQWFKRGGRVWDTQLAEYLLSGHLAKYASLRDIAVNKYGQPEREKKMEKYWDEGKQTSEIPEELVREDVENDVTDTEAVFLAQYKKATELKMLPLIELRMDGLLACIECEYNGMRIERIILHRNKQKLIAEVNTLTTEFTQEAEQYWTTEIKKKGYVCSVK